jgi:hypothetical protein
MACSLLPYYIHLQAGDITKVAFHRLIGSIEAKYYYKLLEIII